MLRQLAEHGVREGPLGRNAQQPRASPLSGRLAGDELVGKCVVEVGETQRPTSYWLSDKAWPQQRLALRS